MKQRRIIGQCHSADFIELLDMEKRKRAGEKVDYTNLTKKQVIAVRVIEYFQNRELSLRLLWEKKIKEVLVWEIDGEKKAYFEFKLMDPGDIETATILQGGGINEQPKSMPSM